MKYKVGDKFTVLPLQGKQYPTEIVSVKYEFSKIVKGKYKYITEKELDELLDNGTLIEGSMSELDAEIRRLEKKFGVKLETKD